MPMPINLDQPQGNFLSGKREGEAGEREKRKIERLKEKKEIADNKNPEQTAG
jgi:hypothetical protein